MAASTRSAASLWTAAWLLFLSAVLALLPAGCGGGTPEHREAAVLYIKFLTEPQQRKALEFGFRPADPKIALAAPIDTAHGVDPRKPHTTLEVPSADICQGIIDLWKKNKKEHIDLVFDISGRMRGEKMTQAKAGAAELVKLQGDDDRLSLCVFNQIVSWPLKGQLLSKSRGPALAHLQSQFADGGTALYDAMLDVHAKLQADRTPGMIRTVVLLSDGADSDSLAASAQG